ncbi:hypothetical protein Ciccas_013918 [Cichlidogyrus casuarinus]|uniref:Cyclic nucleotide-binding domain-containing protein n=1 Tax=Cichlidogyrus casuarinus TaxID=1844966 RepID=A0ABD2PJD6_9PLAT
MFAHRQIVALYLHRGQTFRQLATLPASQMMELRKPNLFVIESEQENEVFLLISGKRKSLILT